jgi:parvulin-like peptidyl-prolyl isomerase
MTQSEIRSPRRRAMALTLLAVIAIGLVIRLSQGTPTAQAQAPTNTAPVSSKPTKPAAATHDVMAIVNGQDISRPALAEACVERFGEDVLESMVNKRLIEHHCANRGITITTQDLEVEIDRLAKRFKISRDQWLELLEKERGVKAEEYKRDILWPTIALRKLAAADLVVSDEELRRAHESQYGASVRVRLIVVSDQKLAQDLSGQLTAQPENFARLAMQHSEDVNSASIGGLIQPIRRHLGEPAIERAAFQLEPGQVSAVIPVNNQFAILKCEGKVPPRGVTLESVQEDLTERIKEEKLRQVAADLFGKLQAAATIQNVYNDPTLRNAMPGVVATVNGNQITMQELGVECLARHGEAVLEMEISHLLLQQELKKANTAVSEADLQAEMTHAAELSGVLDAAGKPDLNQWVKMATQDQGITYEMYVRDSVWPSVALKKLTSSKVQVTPEDMQKGFAANYGEKVRCRAIVLSDMRRAQEVWDKARSNESIEYFGDLAAEYSIEPTSKALRGEVPPVRQHGGQPQLETVAFKLQPGELSGVVQVGDKYIILKCEGRTEPVQVNPAEVQTVLQQDIHEKKLRLAMGEEFEAIRRRARIDNYLAGTSTAPADNQAKSPRTDTAVQPTSGVR